MDDEDENSVDWQRIAEERAKELFKQDERINELIAAASEMVQAGDELRAENERLAKCCTQRGARMQIMRDWMRTYPPYSFRYTTLWDEFAAYKDALPWFDAELWERVDGGQNDE